MRSPCAAATFRATLPKFPQLSGQQEEKPASFGLYPLPLHYATGVRSILPLFAQAPIFSPISKGRALPRLAPFDTYPGLVHRFPLRRRVQPSSGESSRRLSPQQHPLLLERYQTLAPRSRFLLFYPQGSKHHPNPEMRRLTYRRPLQLLLYFRTRHHPSSPHPIRLPHLLLLLLSNRDFLPSRGIPWAHPHPRPAIIALGSQPISHSIRLYRAQTPKDAHKRPAPYPDGLEPYRVQQEPAWPLRPILPREQGVRSYQHRNRSSCFGAILHRPRTPRPPLTQLARPLHRPLSANTRPKDVDPKCSKERFPALLR